MRTALLRAAVLAALPLAAAPAAGAPTVYTVVIDKMKFGTPPPNLRAGDVILWVNRDLFRHSVTARDGSFNLDLPPKGSGRTVVKRKGAIPFFCRYHPGMKGVLVGG
jgi:plastocyanin